MNRLQSCLAKGHKLIVYLMGCDPDARRSLEYMVAAARGGADVLEVGMPFSDPVADGPVIQAAGVRALRGGATLEAVVGVAGEAARRTGLPVVLMGYCNPVFRMGYDIFFRLCRREGVAGVILADLPLEEAGEVAAGARMNSIDLVLLAAPNTPPARLAEMGKTGSGFLYLVSRYGTTGVRKGLPGGLGNMVGRAKRHSRLPVAVGFGVSTARDVALLHAAGADAAVVGSAVVDIVGRGGKPEEVERFVRKLKG